MLYCDRVMVHVLYKHVSEKITPNLNITHCFIYNIYSDNVTVWFLKNVYHFFSKRKDSRNNSCTGVGGVMDYTSNVSLEITDYQC